MLVYSVAIAAVLTLPDTVWSYSTGPVMRRNRRARPNDNIACIGRESYTHGQA